MATKSIYKSINIKSNTSCRALTSALEKAKSKKGKDVQLKKRCVELKGEQVKAYFGDE